MRYILVALLGLLAACAAPQKMNLHEMSADEAPYWNLVTLRGLDDALLKIYEDQYFTLSEKPQGYDLEFDKNEIDHESFKKVGGFVRILKRDDLVYVNFQSCNGISARYKIKKRVWVHQTTGSSMRSCERTVVGKSGKVTVAATPMLADHIFFQLAPEIKGYHVSDDGQMLTLLDADDNALGVFNYRGELQ